MGLNDTYGPVRDQVLGMDHLPSVNKAYSMVLKLESQKEVLGNINNSMDSLALLNKTQGQYQGRQKRNESQKGHCTYCNMDGHVREGCFKLFGYPEWYKPKKKFGGQSFRIDRNVKTWK